MTLTNHTTATTPTATTPTPSGEPSSDLRMYDDPALHTVCDEVEPGEDIDAIVAAMHRALDESKNGVGLAAPQNGVGLAAPQIGVLKRIVIVRTDDKGRIVMVNPVITKKSDQTRVGWEGCLSYPGTQAEVRRYKRVTLQFDDYHAGESRKLKFKDFEAVIVQHEVDHLDGICQVGDVWAERQQA